MTAILTGLFGLLFGFLSVGLWIGIALLATAIGLGMLFTSIPIDRLLPQYVFNILTTPDLVALPLFVLMGEFLFRTKLSAALFSGLAPWAGLLPGRLLHVNVIGCSIFAAISGSSAATTQVVGRMTLKELLRRGYSPDVAIGSLAGAGTLGFLIPPSTVMIMYGVLAEEIGAAPVHRRLPAGGVACRRVQRLDHDPHLDRQEDGARERTRFASHAVPPAPRRA